ncbi:MAG: DUF6577 family protein [Candidatus Bathyarchaeia archaeon]
MVNKHASRIRTLCCKPRPNNNRNKQNLHPKHTRRPHRTRIPRNPKPTKKDFKEHTYYPNKTLYITERNEKYGIVENENLQIPTPESIWIDTYYLTTRKELSFSPAELGRILANMLHREEIKIHRLLRYAQRRNLRDEIITLQSKTTHQTCHTRQPVRRKKEALKVIDEIVEGAKE